MNKLRPCLVNEYKINQEVIDSWLILIRMNIFIDTFKLKARNAQREQSLRESESMQIEQCPMDHSHKEPSRKVHDQHRDKDRSRQV